jgi:hypothetical protein
MTQFHIPGNCEDEIFRGITTKPIQSNYMLLMRKSTIAPHREDRLDISFKVSAKVDFVFESLGYR